MAKIINFRKDNGNEINLYDWSGREGQLGVKSEDELREVFLNMDKALKYVHNHDYCVKSFSPLEIQILNNSPKQIRFTTLLEMPNDSVLKEQLKNEDLFRSACLQIGLYTNTLRYLKKDYLKEHFDDFAKSIPSGDVPYYRGIIQRGAGVYFCEFDYEKKKRDLEALSKEIDSFDGGSNKNKEYVKTNGYNVKDDSLTNDSINDNIYKQINGLNDVAFINYLVIPALVVIAGMAIMLLAWLINI